MNIVKVKNYNQKLLAVIGTIIALIAFIGLLIFLVFAFTEIGRSLNYNNKSNGILSEEKIEELQKENKRQQLVSYDFPRLVDTLNLIYIIPVSQRTLNEPEDIDSEALELLDYSGGFTKKMYSQRFYGSFNNLLIYDLKHDEIKKLFDERISFEEITYQYFEDDIFILFNAAKKDTYKDGVINDDDLKSLFVYSLKEKKLKQIEQAEADVSNFTFVNNSKDLLIHFGIDQNKDGRFENSHEPTIIKKYDYKTGILNTVINKETHNSLQKTLEGTKK